MYHLDDNEFFPGDYVTRADGMYISLVHALYISKLDSLQTLWDVFITIISKSIYNYTNNEKQQLTSYRLVPTVLLY